MTRVEEHAPPTHLRVAIDNDILIKASCYGSAAFLWPQATGMAVLGAARFVVPNAIRHKPPVRGEAAAMSAFEAILVQASELEPTPVETDLAIELERSAASEHLRLDAGESQLAAIVALRAMDELETGDKAGIAALESLLDQVDGIRVLAAKVRCLEQLVRAAIASDEGLDALNDRVCSEPGVDKALSFCFACASGGGRSRSEVLEGIESYINDLRRRATRILAAS